MEVDEGRGKMNASEKAIDLVTSAIQRLGLRELFILLLVSIFCPNE